MNLLIHGLLLTISSSLYAALSKIIIVVYYSLLQQNFTRSILFAMNTVAQKMLFRQSLIRFAEKRCNKGCNQVQCQPPIRLPVEEQL